MTERIAQLRFTRDKRGYEYFALVGPASGHRRREQSRILYWYRTPPGVKVGRVPFDDEVRRLIETQNPGVRFDWPRLLATPQPPPNADIERWRERRRNERAARREQMPQDPHELASVGDEPDAADVSVASVESPVGPTVDRGSSNDQSTPSTFSDHARRRRRRRGGRRHGVAVTSESRIPNPEPRPENPESRPENPQSVIPGPES
jgi:hypothetical protein